MEALKQQYHILEPVIRQNSPPLYQNPLSSLEDVLNEKFHNPSEDSNVIRTRRLLGKRAENFTDEQIECTVAEFQFLIDVWLDEFERETFRGQTLKEVLSEK